MCVCTRSHARAHRAHRRRPTARSPARAYGGWPVSANTRSIGINSICGGAQTGAVLRRTHTYIYTYIMCIKCVTAVAHVRGVNEVTALCTCVVYDNTICVSRVMPSRAASASAKRLEMDAIRVGRILLVNEQRSASYIVGTARVFCIRVQDDYR